METNGRGPQPNTSSGAGRRAATPVSIPLATHTAATLLVLSAIDGNLDAEARALALLDPGEGAVALAVIACLLDAEPRCRCDAARSRVLDHLERLDHTYRFLRRNHV